MKEMLKLTNSRKFALTHQSDCNHLISIEWNSIWLSLIEWKSDSSTTKNASQKSWMKTKERRKPYFSCKPHRRHSSIRSLIQPLGTSAYPLVVACFLRGSLEFIVQCTWTTHTNWNRTSAWIWVIFRYIFFILLFAALHIFLQSSCFLD